MNIKETANIQGLRLEMREVLIVADQVWKDFGISEGVTVTCGLNGTHSAGSMHYYGYALDLRTRYWEGTPHIIEEVARELRKQLGDAYYVQVEATHIHVHYKNWRIKK